MQRFSPSLWQPWIRVCCLVLGILATQATALQAKGTAQIVWRDSLRQALQESSEVRKPMLVEVSTTWCGYCKKMEKETFSDRRIVDHISECFVPVKVDGEQQRDFVKRIGIRSYPTTVILGSDMQVLAKITGYRTPEQLSQDLSTICDRSHESTNDVPLLQASVFGNLCPVTPMETGKFVAGSQDVSMSFRGYQLQFADDASRQKFQQNPAKYWPVADGQCVVSYFDQQHMTAGKVNLGVMYNDRIWMFASAEHLERFKSSPDRYVHLLQQAQTKSQPAEQPAAPIQTARTNRTAAK